MWSSVTSFFLLAQCFQGLSMWKHASDLIPFHHQIILHCVDTPHFAHSSADGCLFPHFGTYKYAAMNMCVCFEVNICYHFSWIHT